MVPTTGLPGNSQFMKLKEKKQFPYIKGQGEAAGAGVEATASHLEDLAKRINESGYIKQEILFFFLIFFICSEFCHTLK